MGLEIQFCSVNYTLVARIYRKFKENRLCWYWCSRQKQYILGFKVNKTFCITFHTEKQFQQYYQPYCNYLLKMGQVMKSKLYLNS